MRRFLVLLSLLASPVLAQDTYLPVATRCGMLRARADALIAPLLAGRGKYTDLKRALDAVRNYRVCTLDLSYPPPGPFDPGYVPLRKELSPPTFRG